MTLKSHVQFEAPFSQPSSRCLPFLSHVQADIHSIFFSRHLLTQGHFSTRTNYSSLMNYCVYLHSLEFFLSLYTHTRIHTHPDLIINGVPLPEVSAAKSSCEVFPDLLLRLLALPRGHSGGTFLVYAYFHMQYR